MCSLEPMSNVSVPVFLEELEHSDGSVAGAFLQAWWRRSFPIEKEALSDVFADHFIEELGEVDGSIGAAFLRTWWRRRVPDAAGWWTQSVLDSGEPFWWRESATTAGEMEVRLRDPREPVEEAPPYSSSSAALEEWTEGILESGAPFWWRDSDEEPDGIEVRLKDPRCGGKVEEGES